MKKTQAYRGFPAFHNPSRPARPLRVHPPYSRPLSTFCSSSQNFLVPEAGRRTDCATAELVCGMRSLNSAIADRQEGHSFWKSGDCVGDTSMRRLSMTEPISRVISWLATGHDRCSFTAWRFPFKVRPWPAKGISIWLLRMPPLGNRWAHCQHGLALGPSESPGSLSTSPTSPLPPFFAFRRARNRP